MNYVPFYNELKTGRDDCFFIGMNTADGFRWADPELFSEKKLQRLYIIKGSAGSGKSTLMKKVADACSDEGYPVTRYICSSDPTSYDGILIDGRIALIDGTAPHTAEMRYPGAVSELINLANFWDAKRLADARDTVIDLSEKKASRYERAYRTLNGVKALTDGMYRDILMITEAHKMEKAILRIIKQFKTDRQSAREEKRIIKSVGMKGSISLDTFKKKAATVFHVKDRFGTSYSFIEMLTEILRGEGMEFHISPDPFFGERASDVFIPANRVLITNGEYPAPDRIINMDRFILTQGLNNVKGSVKLAQKCKELLICDAQKQLIEAGDFHFALEKIYKEAMNFEALNEYTKILTRNILCEL